MMTKYDIEQGLYEAAKILVTAANTINYDTRMGKDQALAIAEQARIDADHAYRKAIGATCEDCGGNTEQHVGNS